MPCAHHAALKAVEQDEFHFRQGVGGEGAEAGFAGVAPPTSYTERCRPVRAMFYRVKLEQ